MCGRTFSGAPATPSVVQVDQSGQLSVVGAGEAVITASFGDAAASLHITVGEEEDLSGDGTGGTGTDAAAGDRCIGFGRAGRCRGE